MLNEHHLLEDETSAELYLNLSGIGVMERFRMWRVRLLISNYPMHKCHHCGGDKPQHRCSNASMVHQEYNIFYLIYTLNKLWRYLIIREAFWLGGKKGVFMTMWQYSIHQSLILHWSTDTVCRNAKNALTVAIHAPCYDRTYLVVYQESVIVAVKHANHTSQTTRAKQVRRKHDILCSHADMR